MAEPKPDKPGFLSRLFGRKADTPAAPEPAQTTPQAGGEPEAMPSPPATGADDLAAAPSTVTTASPDTPEDNKIPAELAGADLQPIEGLDPEGTNPQEPLPRIVTEQGPELRPDIAAADLPAPEPALAEVLPAPALEAQTAPARGWWQRLTDGMRRTSSSLSDSVTGLFTKRKLDAATLEELEDALVQADLGVPTAMRITEA